MTVTIRPFTWDDLDARVALLRELGVTDAAADALRREYLQPDTHPERDSFCAVDGERHVGYLTLVVEAPIARGVLVGGVAPDRRRARIGTRLVEAAASHAGALGLGVLHVDVPEGASDVVALFRMLGYEHMRTHVHMAVDAPQRSDIVLPEGAVVRLLRRNEIAELTALQNAVFNGSWGYSPNTPEQLDYRIYTLIAERPDDVVVLEMEGRIAAYCWCRRRGEGEPGLVGMVGVLPQMQGRGLGKAVTGAGLDLLVDAGARPIEITVDAQNEPGVRLYRSLGFRETWRSVWYERLLR